jgi:tRNA G18 (ribose-2'-O)-methylase SpoU
MKETRKGGKDMININIEAKERVYLVPPVKLALVHLTKPYDLAHVIQVAQATEHCEIFLIGESLSLEHPKVISKVSSWNISKEAIRKLPSIHVSSISELKKNFEGRLIGTSPHAEINAFDFYWQDADCVILGPPNGLSKSDLSLMDEIVKIPTSDKVPFLTIPIVVPALTYHILTQRGLWSRFKG